MKKFYVYKLMDSNGICFYVGKGHYKNYDRIWYHYNRWKYNCNKKLKNKIEKLNGEFLYEIVYESLDEQACFDEEIRLIKLIGRENLCNLTDGGEGASGRIFKHSVNTKIQMSNSRKNSIKAKESSICNIRKAIMSNIGKRKINKLNQESKKFIMQNHTSMTVPDLSRRLNISQYCIREWLRSLNLYDQTLKSKSWSEERKLKLSNNTKGTKGRPVDMFDLNGNFIRSYDSMTQACQSVGAKANPGCITAVCRGYQKTAYGYKWKYKLEKQEEGVSNGK